MSDYCGEALRKHLTDLTVLNRNMTLIYHKYRTTSKHTNSYSVCCTVHSYQFWLASSKMQCAV